MRRALSLLLLIPLLLAGVPQARAQDGAAEPAAPAPLPAPDGPAAVEGAERAYQLAVKRHESAQEALERARRAETRLESRRMQLVDVRNPLDQRLTTLRDQYASDEPPPLSASEVALRVSEQEAALDAEESASVTDSRDSERLAVDEILDDARSRMDGLAVFYAERRAEARAAVQEAGGGDEVWDVERLRWDALESAHRDTVNSLYAASQSVMSLHSECRALREDVRSLRKRTIEVLQANNLTLRGRSRITPDSLTRGLSDLSSLPAWVKGAAEDTAGYLGAESRRSDVVGWLIASLIALVLLLFARMRLARSYRAADEITVDRERVFDLLRRLLGAALFAAAVAAPFLAAAELLGDLPRGVAETLVALGVSLGGFLLVRSLARRLLPSAGAWSPFTIDIRTSALLRTGLQILALLSLLLVPTTLALGYLGYQNAGAIEAMWALYELGVVLTLLVFFFRRNVILQVLPSSELRTGRVLRRIVGVLHPVLVLVGPVVLVLDLLAYEMLAAFLTRLIGGTVVALVAGLVVYSTLWRGLEAWLKTIVSAGKAGETEDSQLDAARRIASYLLRIAVIVGAVFLMLLVQGGDFATLRSFLDVELPFQGQVEGRHITWWNVAAGIVLIALFLSAVGKVKLFLERFVLPRTSLDTGLRYTISTLVGYVIAALGIYIALLQVFDLSALGYVFAALSVGIGFGLQEIVSNFVSGLILLFERPLKVGDLVTVGDQEGWVTKINIRATTIQTRDNVSMLIPNKDFITQAVVNSDYGEPIVRLRVVVGVAYGSDTALVKRLLEEVGRKHPKAMASRKVDVLFRDFGESSLDFELRVWIPEAAEHPTIASDLRYAIDAAFREHGVEIPFPQRDLHLRSVDEGAAGRLRGVDGGPEPGPDEDVPETPSDSAED